MNAEANRRGFVRTLTMLGVGAQALVQSRSVRAAVSEARESVAPRDDWPGMAYRTLGRTGWNASRLVFGCGAALAQRRADHLLGAAFDAGVNVFDVGYRSYYNDAEKNLAPFLKDRRDRVFLISKAQIDIDLDADAEATADERRDAARNWLAHLDDSLRELEVEQVDAYYLMASSNASIIRSDELRAAFEEARAAGKVRFRGLSTHQNARHVLEAAIESGGYALAMVAITPAGWYDWATRAILDATPPMTEIRPLLDRARDSGIGLVGMKAGRFLAGRGMFRRGDEQVFDRYYDARLLGSTLSAFQRSYAYVLGNGVDVVNADMQTFVHLKENFVAAATAHEYSGVAVAATSTPTRPTAS